MILPRADATTVGTTPVPVNPIPGVLSLPEVPPLDNTFGALLIGTFIGLMYVGQTSTRIVEAQGALVGNTAGPRINVITTSVHIMKIGGY